MSLQRELITDDAEIEEARKLAQKYWEDASVCGCLYYQYQSKEILVPLPRTVEGEVKERWVCVNKLDDKVYDVERQPDNFRIALEGVFLQNPPTFCGATYGPNYIYSETVTTHFLNIVLFSMIVSPLCVLFYIPAIYRLIKVCTIILLLYGT